MSQLLEQAHNHRLRGEYPAAEAIYRQLVSEGDSPEACWGLGHTLMNEGDFDGCIEFFERALSLEPDNVVYVLDLAKFLAMLGEDDRAKDLFNQVLAIGGDERCVSEAKKQLAYY